MTHLGKDGSVEFRFLRPDARAVTVAGDFNGWKRDLPMRRDANGWWTLRLALEPGDYRFRYVADGEWYTDFAANGVEADRHGWNSVLVVPGLAPNEAPALEAAADLQYAQQSDAAMKVA